MADSWCTPDDWTYEPPARPEVKTVELCSHCHTEPESRKSKPLCSWCVRTRRRTGELPTPSQIDEHDRRRWAQLSPDYMPGPQHRRRLIRRTQREGYDAIYDLPSLPQWERTIDVASLATM